MSKGDVAKPATAGLIAGVIGGVFGVAVASWLADGNKLLGASWWDALTSIGTVGAVAAAVGLEIFRRRLERKKRAVLAKLAGPTVVAKLVELESTLFGLLTFEERVGLPLTTNSLRRVKLISSLENLQRTLTKEEVDLLVDFELKAAQSISAVNASLAHCIFQLKQFNLAGGENRWERASKFYEFLELAFSAAQAASDQAGRWHTWK